MTSMRDWMIWPDNIVLSVLVLVLIAMVGLYAVRAPMHGIIRTAAYALATALRLAARWLFAAAAAMKERNKAVLLAQGRREVGQRIEREFERVGILVTRDLQGYPVLQRKLLEAITRIEEDYKKCGEVPPPPPDWVEAVAAVAQIKSGGGEVVEKILDEIRQSVGRIHEKALGEYRRAYEERHDILEGALPFWRSIDATLKQVDKKMSDLAENAETVDEQMKKYRQIAAKTDEAESILSHSAFTQFNIAVIVLTIALGGAFVNFKLIALPMSEMVGAGDYITASLRTSEVAAGQHRRDRSAAGLPAQEPGELADGVLALDSFLAGQGFEKARRKEVTMDVVSRHLGTFRETSMTRSTSRSSKVIW